IGLVAMALALRTNFLAGILAIAIGIILASVGFGGPTIASPRFTFGSTYLTEGLNMVAVIIGLLVFSEGIDYLLAGPRRTAAAARAVPKRARAEWGMFLRAM